MKTKWQHDMREYIKNFVLLIIAVLQIGCQVAPYNFSPELTDVPKVMGDATTIVIARKDSSDTTIFHPPIYIEINSNRILKLENGEYSRLLIPVERHIISCNWLEIVEIPKSDIFIIALSVLALRPHPAIFLRELTERSRWHLVDFEGNKNYFILLKLEKESSPYRMKLDLKTYNECPIEISLDNLTFVKAGKLKKNE